MTTRNLEKVSYVEKPMKPHGPRRIVVLSFFLVLATAACDNAVVDLATTSSLIGDGAGVSQSTTTTPPGPTTTSTTTVGVLVGSAVDSYEVIARKSSGAGEVLYIVIPQGAYTDVDLENFVGDLIENGAATWGVEVFDDVLAAEAYQKDEAARTDEEKTLIEQHHFVSLIDGDTIRYQGPFEASGEFVIGS